MANPLTPGPAAERLARLIADAVRPEARPAFFAAAIASARTLRPADVATWEAVRDTLTPAEAPSFALSTVRTPDAYCIGCDTLGVEVGAYRVTWKEAEAAAMGAPVTIERYCDACATLAAMDWPGTVAAIEPAEA